jgi:hypothetical protein
MIEPNVPKPSSSFVPIADDNCDVAPVANHEPKPSGFGAKEIEIQADQAAAEACRIAQDAGLRIVSQFGPALGRKARMKALGALRRVLFPPRRPGRKCKEAVTRAHIDWKNGLRGVALYRAHIPGWEKHSSWRRTAEARALMDAIRTRDRRERRGARDKPEPPTSPPGNDPE